MHFFTQIRRILTTSAPVKFIIRRSKKISLPGFAGIPLYDVVNFFVNQLQKSSLNERAASIAFNLLLAIPPACIFLFTLIPFLPVEGLMNELYELIREILPVRDENEAIINFLSDFTTRQRNDLLSFGFILALFFSSNAMIGILQSFNKIDYIGFSQRNLLQERWVAIKLTVIMFIIILLSIAVMVLRESVLVWLGIENKFILSVLNNSRWVIILLIFFFTISSIYRYAPSISKKWKLINPGSLLSTFLMIAFTMLFSYWVINFGNYNKLYGSLGTILILMLLIFFNSLVLLIGFELNVSINSLKKFADDRKISSTEDSRVSKK